MNKRTLKISADIKWYWNIALVLLIVILCSLGIRSIITDDNRYGWGTYSKQVNYVIKYYYIKSDGTKFQYVPGNELIGDGNNIRYLGNTRYSLGYIKNTVHNYLEYLYGKSKNSEISYYEADIYYVINKNPMKSFDEDDALKTVIKFPEIKAGKPD